MKLVQILASAAFAAGLFAATAGANTVNLASDPFIDLIAVDGGSVFYTKRAPANGGVPITLHRVDIATGADVVIRTYADRDLSPVQLAAGGGRLVVVENSYPPAAMPGYIDVESKVSTMQHDGSSPRELLKQRFKFSPGGYPLGTLTVKRVTTGGETVIQISDSEKAQNPTKLSLVGVRADGTRTTYFVTDRHPNRQISVSDKFFVWWTLRRVGVLGLDNGYSRLRSTRRGVYSAAVDDNGRLLLTTFLGRGRNSNQLRFFNDPNSDRNKLFYSAWKSFAVGRFCGDQLFYARQLAGSFPREITELSAQGERVKNLYTAPPPVRRSDARDFTCDANHAAWRAIRTPSDTGIWNLTVQATKLSE